MGRTGRYRIEYIVGEAQLRAQLRRVEEMLNLHSKKVSVGGMIGLDAQQTKSLQEYTRSLNAQTRAATEARRALERTERATRNVNKQTVLGTSEMRNFAVALRRVTLWAGAGGTVYGLVRLTRSLAQTVTNFQYFRKELIALGSEGAQVYNDLAREAMQAAFDTGRSWQEAADITKAWVRQGRDAIEVTDLLRTTLMGMNLTNLSANDMMKTLTAQMKAFGISANDASSILDKMYGVARRHAVEPGEMAEGLRRFSAVAQEVGLSIDQAYGLLAGTMAKTQQSAQMTGTAMRTILTRILKPAALDTIQTFAKVPVYVDETATSFRNAYFILRDISDQWEQLDQVSRVTIAQAVAGTRRYDQFAASMQNFHEIIASTVDSMASGGEAMRAQEILMNSQRKAAQQLRVAWDELLATRDGFLDFLTALTRGFTLLINKLNSVSKVIPDITTMLLALVGIGGGILVGGPAGGAIGMGLAVALGVIADAGQRAGDSIEVVRKKYEAHLATQQSVAEGNWKLADTFLALAGEADGLTKNEDALLTIQAKLHELLPDMVTQNQSLADTYKVLSSNIEGLGEEYVNAQRKMLDFAIATEQQAIAQMQRERMQKREKGVLNPDQILKSEEKSFGWWLYRPKMPGGFWKHLDRLEILRQFRDLVDQMEQAGRSDLPDVMKLIETNLADSIEQMDALTLKGDALTDTERGRLKMLQTQVKVLQELQSIYREEITKTAELEARQAHLNQLRKEREQLEPPVRTEPEQDAPIVTTLEDFIRKAQIDAGKFKAAMVGTKNSARDVGDEIKNWNRGLRLSEWMWRSTDNHIAYAVEYIGQLEWLLKKGSDLGLQMSNQVLQSLKLQEDFVPLLDRVKEKNEEIQASTTATTEDKKKMQSLYNSMLQLSEKLAGNTRTWKNVSAQVSDAHADIDDKLVDAKADLFKVTDMGVAWERNIRLVGARYGSIAEQQARIAALRKVIADGDKRSVEYLKLYTALKKEEANLDVTMASFRKRAAQDIEQTRLQNELATLAITRGRKAVLQRELEYWKRIRDTTKDIELRARATNEVLRIRATLEETLPQMQAQQLADTAVNLAAQAIRGDLTASGAVTQIGAALGEQIGGWPGFAVKSLGVLVGAALDSSDDLSDALDQNTLAVNRNTQTLQDVLERMVGVPTVFTMPAQIERFGSIPSLQGGGRVVGSGLAVVHSGETVSSNTIGSLNVYVQGAGQSADAIANQVIQKIERAWDIEDRRGYANAPL